MMNKNVVGLSIGSAVLWSLFVSDLGHAVQTESRQDFPKLMMAKLNGTVNVLAAQRSDTANPCHVSGDGKTRAICGKQNLPESGKQVAGWSQYASAIFTVTLTVMLSTLIFMVAFSLALIVLAALSRRTPYPSLEKTGINLSMHGQGQSTSYELTVPLHERESAGWLRRAWVVGLIWFIGFLGSLWFLWLANSIGFIRYSNQTN